MRKKMKLRNTKVNRYAGIDPTMTQYEKPAKVLELKTTGKSKRAVENGHVLRNRQ